MHILGRPVQMLKGIPLQSEIYEVKIMVKLSKKKNGVKTFIYIKVLIMCTRVVGVFCVVYFQVLKHSLRPGILR